jgi:hypothetical protein
LGVDAGEAVVVDERGVGVGAAVFAGDGVVVEELEGALGEPRSGRAFQVWRAAARQSVS